MLPQIQRTLPSGKGKIASKAEPSSAQTVFVTHWVSTEPSLSALFSWFLPSVFGLPSTIGLKKLFYRLCTPVCYLPLTAFWSSSLDHYSFMLPSGSVQVDCIVTHPRRQWHSAVSQSAEWTMAGFQWVYPALLEAGLLPETTLISRGETHTWLSAVRRHCAGKDRKLELKSWYSHLSLFIWNF